MKRVLFVLICVCLTAVTQAAIVGFEAEDTNRYSVAGANWQTVEDAAASGGAYITAIVNGTTHIAANDRHYEIPLSAGSYNVYVRMYIGPNTANDDSCYVSANAFGAGAAMALWNGVADDAFAGEDTTENYGWAQLQEDGNNNVRVYTLASDGTAVWKLSPREDGLRIDAVAFVTDGQAVTPAELTEAVLSSHFIRGAATDPVPSGETLEDSQTTTEVSWTAPVDPNLVSVDGYDVYFGTDPNIIANPMTSVTTEALPVTLAYDTTYYWRVDTHVTWNSNDISGTGLYTQTVEGFDWFFTTLPADLTPDVSADDVLTSMIFLPATLTGTVDDHGENDIATVAWELLGTAAVPAAKQMITRGNDLSSVTSEPKLLMDWIGTDTRQVGNPMYLTVKGLPAATYSWTSYHHDAGDQQGTFDVKVFDASGATTTKDIQLSFGNTPPAATLPLTITSNGTDDVVLVFDLQDATVVNQQFFVMNGFELTDGVSVDPLYIDFGSTDANNLMTGYQLYQADHEVASTFTEQSYSAFGTTVSVLPTWAGIPEAATVTDTTNDPSSASQTAAFSADWPGLYLVRLSATDDTVYGADALTDSDTMTVTVAADACEAAQLSASWSGFSDGDFNEDCVVNLEDFASLASDWLNDRKLTAQE